MFGNRGGHDVAAGAQIPADKLEEFLRNVDEHPQEAKVHFGDSAMSS